MVPCFSQIAIAIGVLTSNRGEGDEPLWRYWTWHQGCHCRVQWTWCTLLGAIAGCYGGGGEGDDQLWGSGHCWVPCHSSVLWLGGRVTTKLTWCHCRVPL